MSYVVYYIYYYFWIGTLWCWDFVDLSLNRTFQTLHNAHSNKLNQEERKIKKTSHPVWPQSAQCWGPSCWSNLRWCPRLSEEWECLCLQMPWNWLGRLYARISIWWKALPAAHYTVAQLVSSKPYSGPLLHTDQEPWPWKLKGLSKSSKGCTVGSRDPIL